MPKTLEQAIGLLHASRYTIALTGAGISTPSGIPDFRGEHSGLWRLQDPFAVASIWAFHDDPAQFYHWIRPVILKAKTARPNPAHLALATLEQTGHLKAVITQNIDALHQRAGSQRVLELHGHVRTATCWGCGQTLPAEALWSAIAAGEPPPVCPQCAARLKPDVILFGEPVPYDTLSAAQQEALACEVMLIVGSSLEVMPAADLPLLAKRRGARTVLINLTPTPLDGEMDLVVREDVVTALQAIRRALVA